MDVDAAYTVVYLEYTDGIDWIMDFTAWNGRRTSQNACSLGVYAVCMFRGR